MRRLLAAAAVLLAVVTAIAVWPLFPSFENRPSSEVCVGMPGDFPPDSVRRFPEAGVFVVNCPQSNARNGVGETDVQGLLDAGVRVGLGSDGFLGGLTEEMKLGPAGAETAGGQLFVGNALAASSVFGRPVGTLSPGSDADFFTLDASGRVRRTVSRGRVLYDAAGLRGWNLEDLEALAAEQAERLAERIQALEGP